LERQLLIVSTLTRRGGAPAALADLDREVFIGELAEVVIDPGPPHPGHQREFGDV
jgi:hypothetical protein